jgi:hypothetical protein
LTFLSFSVLKVLNPKGKSWVFSISGDNRLWKQILQR